MYYVSPPKSCDVAFNQWGREGGEMMGDGGGGRAGSLLARPTTKPPKYTHRVAMAICVSLAAVG